MSQTVTKNAAPSKTYFCIWPDHKMRIGAVHRTMTAMGERGHYASNQLVKFENQRFTTSDPEVIALMDAEVARQPMVLGHKWIANPVLAKRDDASTPGPDDDVNPFILRGPAAT